MHYTNDMWVCEDIPIELLELKDTTFKQTNKRFMRMLTSIFNISQKDKFLIGNAVNLNINWFLKKPATFHWDRLYRIDYEQLRRG